MKTSLILLLLTGILFFGLNAFERPREKYKYFDLYAERIKEFEIQQQKLMGIIQVSEDPKSKESEIKSAISRARLELKKIDFWIRYFEPLAYKKINGPLPVEWETEVFEKFEKPYKREGAGLTLAYLCFDDEQVRKDSLLSLVNQGTLALQCYKADSITEELKTFSHFYLCNRLFLLNLAAIYTTGFENPDWKTIIPELRISLEAVKEIYLTFNIAFPKQSLPDSYLSIFNSTLDFVNHQPDDFEKFDHYEFIRTFVNPLYAVNQSLIAQFNVQSKSFVDYSLNRKAKSIFTKDLYFGQNEKGVFLRVADSATLNEIEKLGRLLFFDPILSKNNQRSCASCHKIDNFFTDTTVATALTYNRDSRLPRNTPTLVNASLNHLIMADGIHISLQDQVRGVVSNPNEMGSEENELVLKVLSCKEYKSGFEKLLPYTPIYEEISMNHISSAITYYYSKYSRFEAEFDKMMNQELLTDEKVKRGFNLFMSKAQCATCHFVPQFNGVKPPYVGSEFEVLGVPKYTNYQFLSADKGRYLVNPAIETLQDRKSTRLNSSHT